MEQSKEEQERQNLVNLVKHLGKSVGQLNTENNKYRALLIEIRDKINKALEPDPDTKEDEGTIFQQNKKYWKSIEDKQKDS